MSVITYNGSKVIFNENVLENELVELRSFLQENIDKKIIFDLSSCNDMHTAIVQLLVAFKATYSCDFVIADRSKPYAMAIDVFVGE